MNVKISIIKVRMFTMALSTITARLEATNKVNFDSFCSLGGLNTSIIAINLFVNAVSPSRLPSL